jgi:hypothetical protein
MWPMPFRGQINYNLTIPLPCQITQMLSEEQICHGNLDKSILESLTIVNCKTN